MDRGSRAFPNRGMGSVSMYPASPTKIAGAFGFMAFVLLSGGNANAQAGCYGGTGWEELSRAVKAIEAVNVEVESIEEYYARGSKVLSMEYSIEDEHSCLAGYRSWACAKFTVEGMGTREVCSSSAPTPRGGSFHTEFEFSRTSSDESVTAQVRVRYYGSGGAWAPWSPEYTADVPFVRSRYEW